MDMENTVRIESDTETICCDGGQDSLGHPTVYYTFDNKKEVVCDYCNKKFIKKNKD